jgi:hypothetical protein
VQIKSSCYGSLISESLKRDGVCNPVTHVLKVIKNFKRFGRGCKPRPTSEKLEIYSCFERYCIYLQPYTFRIQLLNNTL